MLFARRAWWRLNRNEQPETVSCRRQKVQPEHSCSQTGTVSVSQGSTTLPSSLSQFNPPVVHSKLPQPSAPNRYSGRRNYQARSGRNVTMIAIIQTIYCTPHPKGDRNSVRHRLACCPSNYDCSDGHCLSSRQVHRAAQTPLIRTFLTQGLEARGAPRQRNRHQKTHTRGWHIPPSFGGVRL